MIALSARSCAWPMLAVALLGCAPREDVPGSTKARATRTWSVPVADPGTVCADLSDVRVCWDSAPGDSCDPACVLPRPVPLVPPLSKLGWRCTGSGANRRCIDRARGAGAFRCVAERCTQRHPRLPDDGEWTCEDVSGAVLCVGGDAPAGVPAIVSDPAFLCGERITAHRTGEQAERICIDWAPDFPDGLAKGWRCRYATEEGLSRVCERDQAAHAIGDTCDPARPCLDGLRCVAKRCVPVRPIPSCSLDRDCSEGVCRFGSCRGEPG